MEKKDITATTVFKEGMEIPFVCHAPDGTSFELKGILTNVHGERLTLRVDTPVRNMTLSGGNRVHVSHDNILYRIVELHDFPNITIEKASERKHVRVDDILKLRYANVTGRYDATAESQAVFEEVFHENYTIPDIQEVKSKDLYDLLYLVNLKMDELLERLGRGEPADKPPVSSHHPINISASGMRFISRDHFTVGDIYALKLGLPLVNRTSLNLLGEVVSVTETTSPDEFSVALQFIDLSTTDQEVLTRYIFQRQRELLRG